MYKDEAERKKFPERVYIGIIPSDCDLRDDEDEIEEDEDDREEEEKIKRIRLSKMATETFEDEDLEEMAIGTKVDEMEDGERVAVYRLEQVKVVKVQRVLKDELLEP